MSSFSRLLNRCFSTSPLTEATTSIYKERNLRRLADKFKKSSEAERFRTKNGIYEDTVRRLIAAKRFELIEDILEDQKKYKDISKEGFSVRLISLYGRAGMFEHAQKVFDEMAERDCKRTVLSFNALLSACVNSNKFDKIDSIFKELPTKLSIEPDLVSYNTLIKASCQMGSFDSAISLLDEIERKGFKPNLITFNTLLFELYKNGLFSHGDRVWSLMNDKDVAPDIRSYNAKLQGLVTQKKLKEAVELIDEMKNKGIKPDVLGINILIKGFVSEGNLEEAKRWYHEIEKSEFDPNKMTFAILIPFLCEKGDLAMAFALSKEVFNSMCLLDAKLLQLVVERLVKESKISEAEELVQLGKMNSYCRYKLNLPSDQQDNAPRSVPNV